MAAVDRETVEGLLAEFTAKDRSAVLARFADDAVLIDPHYPTPRMVGKAAIAAGLDWVFRAIEQPGFTLRHLWLDGPDGTSGAVEIDTHHRIRSSLVVTFSQVFIFEANADGQFTRLQAYMPYGPQGLQGALLTLTRLAWRLRPRARKAAR